MRAACAVVAALFLLGCPEPAPKGFDPSNPQKLDPSLNRPPPPGTLPPNVPPPPPETKPREEPKPAEPAPEAAAPAPPAPKEEAPKPAPVAAPPKADLKADFVLSLRPGKDEWLVFEGGAKGASVRDVKPGKDGEPTLKVGKLGGKEAAALLTALDAMKWWTFPPGDESGTCLVLARGKTRAVVPVSCDPCGDPAGNCPCLGKKGVGLLRAAAGHLKDAPATQLLKFKPPGAARAKPEHVHCSGHERPGFVTCAREGGPVNHCVGKGKSFVCYLSPYDPKGVAVVSDTPVDDKKKPAPPDQPWAAELDGERCVRNDGRWSCEKGTELERVSMGKTWVAWPTRGEPRAVKAGYAE